MINSEEIHNLIDDKLEYGLKKEDEYFKGLFEALLFMSNDPLPLSFFVKNLGIASKSAKEIINSLIEEYRKRDGGIKLREISGGYQFFTDVRYVEEIKRIMSIKKREGITKGMLETLAIIAYRQPIILAEVEELRGVSSRMMLANLMKRNLIKPVGRKELPGRPLLYRTTDEFLRYFGLNDLSDLPKMSEIIEEYYCEDEE